LIGYTDRRLTYFGGVFENRARHEPLIVGYQTFFGSVQERHEVDGSISQTRGFGWSARLYAGAGTSRDRPIAASITLGLGGSGASGIVSEALELPIEARVEFPGRTWPMGYARATRAFSDERVPRSRLPAFDELELGIEFKRLLGDSPISLRSVALRFQYREALGQRLVGASLMFGLGGPPYPAHDDVDR
jgi:hypothetical protein